MKSIGSEVFGNCTGLTSVTIPNSVTRIGRFAFFNCTSLTSITIPNSVTSLGESAFSGCSGLTSITIPNSVTSIGNSAFSGCSGLTSITIPNSVTSIGNWGLSRCSSLTSVTIPNSVKSIGNFAFYKCSGLTFITIGNSVTSIGESTFYGCEGLIDVTCLAESVPSTKSDAFAYSSINNATLHVPESSIETYKSTEPWKRFKEIVALSDNENPIVINGIYYTLDTSNKTAKMTSLLNNISEIAIPFSITSNSLEYIITSIGERAFSNGTNLISITIPQSIREIGDYAFSGCTKLFEVYCNAETVPIVSDLTFKNSNITNATLYVPAGTKSLYNNADGWKLFANIVEKEAQNNNITFANPTVKAICVANWDTNGDGELSEDEAAAVASLNKAFSNNREITSFDELRYFTGLTAVSDMDFFFCTSLVSMTLPKNLADVPETTFTGCESLTNLKVAEGNEYYCTIDGLLYDKNITLLLFCPTKKTGAVVVPATVKRIGTNGFYECAELTAITLPDKLEELGDAVFVGCTNLTTIHIPASVKIMGLGQVSACTNLESITVDEANTYFQSIDGVLYTKSDLTLMSYPNKKGKEYVVLDGTKGIDAYSFCYTEIEKVTLPASIIGIGYLAFGYCENLKTIVSLNPAPIAAGIRPDIMNDDEYEGVTLMVPYGSKSLYEASNGWNMFTNIVEMPDANAITVTADNLTMEYGDAIPELTYKVEGGVLAGTPELSCEATSTSPAGTYDIIVSKGTVENENVTYVAGKLTINQAPLTISAGTYTKKQYDPMPEIVLTYDGFKNNETAIVLTKQATISCEADEDSAPGEYTITLSGAEAANYEISYVAGKLTVNEPDSFTLAYIVDGELYRSFIVKYKEAITPLEEPTKEGYTFSGWSEIPETMPAHDVTVTGTFTLDSTGINQIMRDENGNTMIFTIDGRRVDKPQKNLNIIRMKDGTTRKVMMK